MKKVRRLLPLLLIMTMILACFGNAMAEGTEPKLTEIGQISARIIIKGTAPTPAESYSIEMKADDAAYPMPDGSSAGTYTQAVPVGKDVELPEIKYDHYGIYTYTIKQLVDTPEAVKGQMIHDETVYTMKVSVYRDEATNETRMAVALRSEGSDTKKGEIEFINVRKTAPLVVEKAITVPAGYTADSAKVFTFTVKLNEVLTDEFKAPEGVTLAADRQTLTFSLKDGAKQQIDNLPVGAEYTITEDAADGYNDGKPVTVTGVVKEQDADAKENVNAETIENKYAASGTAMLQVSKNLLGRAWEDDTFSFTLAPQNGAPVNGTAAKVTKAGENAVFGTITYTTPGDYAYVITEDIPEDAVDGMHDFILYDGTEVKVAVKVTDNKDGTLSAAVTYDGEASHTFVNRFQKMDLMKTITKIERNGEAVTDLSKAQAGDVITYTITAINSGAVDIPAGTKITDTMTRTLKDNTTKTETTTLTTKSNPLAVGKSEELTYTYIVKDEDKLLKNAAVKDLPGEDPPPVLTPIESVKTTKTITAITRNGAPVSGLNNAQAGDVVTYTITVTNNGEVDLPAGLKVIDTLTRTLKDGTTETITKELLTEGALAVGKSEDLTYTYTVADTDKHLTNVAVSDLPGDNPPPPVETPIASVVIVKTTTSTPANGTAYVPGETITYDIVVTNDGDTPLTDVVVTDEMTGDTWTLPSLASGATETFTTSYVVTEEDGKAGTVLNVVTVIGKDPNGDPVPDDDDEEDPTQATVILTITKAWVDTPATAARPANLIMTLSGDGFGGTVTLNAANNWTASITDLPRFRNGQEITYTWTEPAIPGYTQTSITTSITGQEITTTITNTRNRIPPRVPVIEEDETPLGLGIVYVNVGDCLE